MKTDMEFGFVTVAQIVIIAYLFGEIAKASKMDNKFIPIVCGVVGGIVGVFAYAIGMPDFPANDIITAIAIGIFSGFAATGINQITKQLKKDK